MLDSQSLEVAFEKLDLKHFSWLFQRNKATNSVFENPPFPLHTLVVLLNLNNSTLLQKLLQEKYFPIIYGKYN